MQVTLVRPALVDLARAAKQGGQYAKGQWHVLVYTAHNGEHSEHGEHVSTKGEEVVKHAEKGNHDESGGLG